MGPAEYRAILAGIGLILDSLPAISAASKGWTEEERQVARDETAAILERARKRQQEADGIAPTE